MKLCHYRIFKLPLCTTGIAVGIIAGATVGAGIFIVLVLVVVLSLIILVYHNKRKGTHNMELLGYRIDIRFVNQALFACRVAPVGRGGSSHCLFSKCIRI